MKLLQGKYRALEKDDAFKDLMAAGQAFVDDTLSELSDLMSGNMTEEDKSAVMVLATKKKFRQETLDFLMARLKNNV